MPQALHGDALEGFLGQLGKVGHLHAGTLEEFPVCLHARQGIELRVGHQDTACSAAIREGLVQRRGAGVQVGRHRKLAAHAGGNFLEKRRPFILLADDDDAAFGQEPLQGSHDEGAAQPREEKAGKHDNQELCPVDVLGEQEQQG